MKRFCVCVLSGLVMAAMLPAGAEAENSTDPVLAAARRYVEESDKYMYHSRLKPGMEGYGLTVFKGTKIEKFDVKIVSIMRNKGPKTDAILAMVSGHGLEVSRVAHGMSGSPVYMKDPKDGKYKMIGAVAFGWHGDLTALCGIQPITQMLALPGILPREKIKPKAKPKDEPKAPKAGKTDAKSEKKPEAKPQDKPGPKKETPRPAGRQAGLSTDKFLSIILNPKKSDFAGLYEAKAENAASAPDGRLVSLRTPLLVSGCGSGTLAWLGKKFGPMGITPLTSGSFGGVSDKELMDTKLEPGSSLAIPYVTGDVDWVGMGTVTEVIGNQVLGFGHSMDAAGNVKLPMFTGYIHTFVSLRTGSFKLGSGIRHVGVLNRDEETAVGGLVGPKVRMIPMTVMVDQVEDKRKQVFEYNLVDHYYFTPLMGAALVGASAEALRLPPQYYHTQYDVTIDFGKLGTYKTSNISTGLNASWWNTWDAASDVHRPLAGLMNNSFGPAPKVERIDVKITIRTGDIGARIIDCKLDAKIYKPGDTVTGHVLLELFRRKRVKTPFKLRLPDDLPEGKYPLTVGDMYFALSEAQEERPQDYRPHTVKQLFTALRKVVVRRADNLYLHLPLPEGGIAMGQKELPDLPPGKARVLLEARVPDTNTFRQSIIVGRKTPYVISGRRTVHVTVKKHTNEMLVR